jgi:hypothetical protein
MSLLSFILAKDNQLRKAPAAFAFSSLLSLLIVVSQPLEAQVAINSGGYSPNTKAMLDISSSTKGLLIPRMSTAQRNVFEGTLNATENGMLVFDSDLNAIYYFDGSVFQEVSNGVLSKLQDNDGDTWVDAEFTPDEDEINFSCNGTVYFTMSPGRLTTRNNGEAVFIGYRAGNNANVLSTTRSIGIGYEALYTNETADDNIAIGGEALHDNYYGDKNMAIGYRSLEYNSSGHDNIALGYYALNTNLSGDKNIAIGSSSLIGATGNNNIGLGHAAGSNISTGGNNIVIGYAIDAPSATVSNQLNIGNLIFGTGVDGTGGTISSGNIGIGRKSPGYRLDVMGDARIESDTGPVKLYVDGTSGNSGFTFQESGAYRGSVGYNADDDYLFLYEGGNVVVKGGNLGAGTTTPNYRLQVGNAGDGSSARANAWNTFSDISLKDNLSVIEHPLKKINQVSGYYYYWKEGADKSRKVGVVAQEIEKVLPEIVSTDSEGIKSVDYSKLTPLLIEAIKAQQEQIDAQNEKLRVLEAKLAAMQ